MSIQNLFESFVERVPGFDCWLWVGPKAGDGYGKFLYDYAHRNAYKLYKGPIPEDLWVLHKCDVRCCVNPEHLYVGTHQDNVKDAVDRERHKKPFTHRPSRRKLTPEQESVVITLAAEGCPQRDIAEVFGVSQWSIGSILKGRPKYVRE